MALHHTWEAEGLLDAAQGDLSSTKVLCSRVLWYWNYYAKTVIENCDQNQYVLKLRWIYRWLCTTHGWLRACDMQSFWDLCTTKNLSESYGSEFVPLFVCKQVALHKKLLLYNACVLWLLVRPRYHSNCVEEIWSYYALWAYWGCMSSKFWGPSVSVTWVWLISIVSWSQEKLPILFALQ